MATALEIAIDTALSIGTSPPASLVSGDIKGRRMAVHMNRGGQALLSKRGAFGEGWPHTNKRYQFTTEDGVAFYALPDDFTSVIEETIWDVTDGWAGRGPLTPAEDQLLRYYRSAVTGAIGPLYRQREEGGTTGLEIHPTPSSERIISLEYISQHWLRETANRAPTKARITLDTDVPIFKEHIVSLDLAWRYKKQLGQAFDIELAEFELERDRTFAQSLPIRDIRFNYSDIEDPQLNFASNPIVID